MSCASDCQSDDFRLSKNNKYAYLWSKTLDLLLFTECMGHCDAGKCIAECVSS